MPQKPPRRKKIFCWRRSKRLPPRKFARTRCRISRSRSPHLGGARPQPCSRMRPGVPMPATFSTPSAAAAERESFLSKGTTPFASSWKPEPPKPPPRRINDRRPTFSNRPHLQLVPAEPRPRRLLEVRLHVLDLRAAFGRHLGLLLASVDLH